MTTLKLTTVLCTSCRFVWQEDVSGHPEVVGKHTLHCPRCSSPGARITIDNIAGEQPQRARAKNDLRGFGE